MKNCLNSLSRSRYHQNLVPSTNRCFSLRCGPNSWVDAFEKFRSRIGSLSSAYIKGSGWWSFSGLYASSPSCNSHVTMFKISYIHAAIWLRNRKVWVMRDWFYGKKNIGVLEMVLVLAIYSFQIYHEINSSP